MDAAKTGAFIAAIRRERNMTQAELAAVLHVTDKAVSKWERGAGLPDINLIEPLAAALDVSVLELMQGRRIAAETVCRAEAAEMPTDILGMAKHARADRRSRPKQADRFLSGLLESIGLLFLLCSVYCRMQLHTGIPLWGTISTLVLVAAILLAKFALHRSSDIRS